MVEEKSLASQYVKIVLVIAAYWVVSISMVFLNSHLLSSATRLEAPLFITFTQCVVTVGVCLLLSLLSKIFPKFFWFPECKFSVEKLWKLLPVSVFFVAMITFNNICLKLVGVAFYTVSRSLTTVFNVVFTFLILRQRTSFPAILCCAVIIGGFFLGIDQEGQSKSYSLTGIIFGVLASASLSLYSIYTKKVLKVVDNSVSLMSFYNNVNATLMFIPLIVCSGEVPTVLNFRLLSSIDWWFEVILVGVFGFAIGYVTMLQIQVTSPLTHNVSGTAKACAQTVLAVFWFDQMKSTLWWVSNSLVLLGSAMYTRVKQQEMAEQHKQKLRTPKEDREKLLAKV